MTVRKNSSVSRSDDNIKRRRRTTIINSKAWPCIGIPIVFVVVPDPMGSGFRLGSNAIEFMMFEYNLCGKWLELLKEIAPSVTQAAVLCDPTFGGIGQFAVIQAAAPSVSIEVSPVNLREPNKIEHAIGTFAQLLNGGIIQTASGIGAASHHGGSPL